MLHGRGSNAKSVLTLVDEFHHHGVTYLAPQAAGSSWYPGSEVDEDGPYLPAERVRGSARAFEGLGGDVTVRLYDGLGHAINNDEIRRADALVGRLV